MSRDLHTKCVTIVAVAIITQCVQVFVQCLALLIDLPPTHACTVTVAAINKVNDYL